MNVIVLTGDKGVLETFSTFLHKFQFDKAKELIDEFRNKSNHSAVAADDGNEYIVWNSLLQCLSQLALADKSYMTLTFLLPKGFLRKESSLRSSYNIIRAELDKLCDGYAEEFSEEKSEKLVHHFLQQFRHYVLARIDMMNCYEKLSTLSSSTRTLTFEQAIDMVHEIEQNHRGTFYHPSISPLELSFSYECEILLNLLKCNSKLSELRFLDCLLLLKEAQSTLKIWSNEPTNNGASKFQQGSSWFGFGGLSKTNALPSLCIWLKRFYDALLAKYSLYFYELLSEQTNPQEMRVQMSKLHLNYYQQIVNFHRKHDAGNICLLLNAAALDHMQWQGYRHPDQRNESLKGLENYPIIFCHPYVMLFLMAKAYPKDLYVSSHIIYRSRVVIGTWCNGSYSTESSTFVELELLCENVIFSVYKPFSHATMASQLNTTTLFVVTTVSSVNKLAAQSTKSPLSSFLFNFENFTNLWSNMGVVAGGVLALGILLWICSCFCCRSKLSQQESWCWCICCCPDFELPLVSKKVRGFAMQQPITAWAPPPNHQELYGNQTAK